MRHLQDGLDGSGLAAQRLVQTFAKVQARLEEVRALQGIISVGTP